MRVTLIAVCLMAVVAVVMSETCMQSSDCQMLNCAGSERCEDRTCTCVTAGMHPQCTMRDDCTNMHHCVQDSIHCVDGHCRCTHH